MTSILVMNMMQEEEIARQRALLNNEILPGCVAPQRQANATTRHSAQNLLFDIAALGRCIGPRLSEYAQTTQDKVDYHTYLSGHQVIKAFIGDDFLLYDSKRRVLTDLTLDTVDKACTVKIIRNRTQGNINRTFFA